MSAIVFIACFLTMSCVAATELALRTEANIIGKNVATFGSSVASAYARTDPRLMYKIALACQYSRDYSHLGFHVDNAYQHIRVYLHARDKYAVVCYVPENHLEKQTAKMQQGILKHVLAEVEYVNVRYPDHKIVVTGYSTGSWKAAFVNSMTNFDTYMFDPLDWCTSCNIRNYLYSILPARLVLADMFAGYSVATTEAERARYYAFTEEGSVWHYNIAEDVVDRLMDVVDTMLGLVTQLEQLVEEDNLSHAHALAKSSLSLYFSEVIPAPFNELAVTILGDVLDGFRKGIVEHITARRQQRLDRATMNMGRMIYYVQGAVTSSAHVYAIDNYASVITGETGQHVFKKAMLHYAA